MTHDELLDEVIGKLGAAAMQIIPSDDQVIADHVLDSVAMLLRFKHNQRAATAEMIAALEKIEGGFINSDFVMSNPPDWHSAFNQLQSIARAAIAKYRGETP
jgi:hypothetical protein